ncbi:GAF domain-containing protein [Undibacterium amnicola]|uniref:histidine kinase n=1 Tax=Undibacterium amnicola TaxID=1834038 RepID=A0ABR6XQJ5_9BURK|nr:two-component regulator propeller domain-containing protein [Undibacterium amnicola]MBC3831172.1 GAF domain-containing protein [Undibacterium amnicola]
MRILGFHKAISSFCCLLGWLIFTDIHPAYADSKQNLRFTHISQEQGLSDGSVPSIFQDKLGLMWIGTSTGLARYDGRRTRQWSSDPEEKHSLSGPLVSSILQGHQDYLWIATSGGLDRINTKTEQIDREAMPAELSLQQRRVWSLAANTQDKIWVATHTRLYLFDPHANSEQRFQAIPLSGDDGAQLRSITSDGQGGIWAALGSRVFHLTASAVVAQQFDAASVNTHKSRVDFSVRYMALDDQHRLWLGTQTGLQIWNVKQTQAQLDPLNAQLNLPNERIFAILMDEEKSMWIGYGGNNALYRIRPKDTVKIEQYKNYPTLTSSIISNSIASLFQDRTGTLWVGTWGNGISLVDLRSKGFTHYFHLDEEKNSLSNNNVMGIQLDRAGKAWVATYGGALNYLDLETGKTRQFPQNETGSRFTKALHLQNDQQLWLGGDDGLVRFNPRTKISEKIALSQETPGAKSISSIIIDQRGDLWAGSGNGLYRVSPELKVETFKASRDQPGYLTHDTVDCLLEDKEGRIWIGTKGGLQLWDFKTEKFSQTVTPTAEVKNPNALSIYGLHQDRSGKIWVGTSTGLFQLIQSGQQWHLKSWRKVSGMPAGWVITIQDDDKGNLWLGAEKGLVQLMPEVANARVYSNFNGPVKGSFSFGATTQASDGRLFFGAWGLIVFRPEELKDNHAKIPVILSDILAFNRSLSDNSVEPQIDQIQGTSTSQQSSSLAEIGISTLVHEANEIHLTPKHSMISFEFSALQFYDYQLNRYAWKLEGFDQDWIYGKPGEGLATYTNLDQGNYVLKVKTASATGEWNENALQLKIRVSPPIWKSWWFQLLLVCCVSALFILFYRLRVGFLKRTRDHLELQVKLRTQEVHEQKDQLRQEKEIAEQEREVADKARRDIILLSEIGREISASLDIEAIQKVFYTHVSKLMDADVYGIGMVDWDQKVVTFDNVLDQGLPAKRYSRSLDANNQPAALCILTGQELNIGQFDHDNTLDDNTHLGVMHRKRSDDSEVTRTNSGLYVPMFIDNQVIGVITVLSTRPYAYDSTHLDMLRTLGAYAAVALDKARAYERVKLAQSKLVEQEKLAALGSIVAGVAHELNTPIGNSLLVASSLKEKNDEFIQSIRNGNLKRSEMERFCRNSTEAVELIVRNLDTSAQLVSSFKQISADQTSNQRRTFDLAKICEELARTLAARTRRDGHQLQVSIESGIMMDSFPGPLGQVLSNLIINAIVHGFESGKPGEIKIEAELYNQTFVILRCKDNGKGIPEKNLKRIFEPFFTTRLGQGGSGLGLHISYNIVHSILGGSISVRSQQNVGTSFALELPLVAPQNASN